MNKYNKKKYKNHNDYYDDYEDEYDDYDDYEDYEDLPPRKKPNKRRQIREAREQEQKRKKTIKRRIFLILFLVIVVFGGFFLLSKIIFQEDKKGELTNVTVDITIPAGSSTKDIAEILKENDLIFSSYLFRLKSRTDGYDGLYKQGDYTVDTGLSDTEIMELLQTGIVIMEQEGTKITIPEGYNTLQIAQRVEESGFTTADDFIFATQNGNFHYEFLNGINMDREYPLEGYLFPNTYIVTEKNNVYDLIDLMLKEFQRVYETDMLPALENYTLGYTLDEIVTMASIVEKEIVLTEERPRAAGVIYNRLNTGMPLQMDATVLYAMGIVKEDITYTDLEIDSPYNTYKVSGIPIGPISNPGKLSLMALLQPEEHNYIYYVLEARGQSNHVYTETYDEFLKAKEKYKNS